MSDDETANASALAEIVMRLTLFDESILVIAPASAADLYAIRETGRRNVTAFVTDPAVAAAIRSGWRDLAEAVDIHEGTAGELLAAAPTRGFALVIDNVANLDPALVAAVAENAVLAVGKDPRPYLATGLRALGETVLPDGRMAHGFLVTEAVRKAP